MAVHDNISNNNTSNNNKTKVVSFGEVRVREHERILVDQPENDVYACLAIGWGHRRSSIVNSLNSNEDENENEHQQQVESDDDDDDDIDIYELYRRSGGGRRNDYDISTSSCSTSSTSSQSACSSTSTTLPRYTASERVKVLNDYGFEMQEVLRNEIQKKRQGETRFAQQQKQQHQQQQQLQCTRIKKTNRSLFSPQQRARVAVRGLLSTLSGGSGGNKKKKLQKQ